MQLDVWSSLFQLLRPGVALTELEARARRVMSRLVPTQGLIVGATCRLVIRGCGLGGDLPSWSQAGRSIESRGPEEIQPGHCFALFPVVSLGTRWVCWSDTVAVTGRGARRLGSASQGFRGAEG